jgi:hypothetical protein
MQHEEILKISMDGIIIRVNLIFFYFWVSGNKWIAFYMILQCYTKFLARVSICAFFILNV